ncbi:CLUMA_CG003963, isoform A [Clunio marinus]|uniref:CLUMA_CG003963, isoform A n=1 Tax=Clunio marinus TaxID=568069 RepID=A0A1J1HS91_9DIPT|nr:CLUMA_CG003963, isoform A [Clunio marinus]
MQHILSLFKLQPQARDRSGQNFLLLLLTSLSFATTRVAVLDMLTIYRKCFLSFLCLPSVVVCILNRT